MTTKVRPTVMLVAFVVVTLTTTASADPDFLFDRDGESMMPGVRRRVSPSGRARTPAPAHDSPIFFPGGGVGGSGSLEPDSNPVLELPFDMEELDMSVLNRLNSVSNISAFADLFDVVLPESSEPEFDTPDITVRVGGNPSDDGEKYEMASCKPELVTVPLDLPVEANTVFFPTCIRLEQCGGCCYGPLLTCRPSVTKVVKVKVLKVVASSRSNNGRGGRRRRRQNTSNYHTVEAVKHTKCECGCKVREEDCNSDIHTYFEGECSCVCKNKDEKAKCEASNSTKYWDNDSCSCFCRKPLDCGSGDFFSQASCSCERIGARSGGIVFESEGTES